jgi:uncharacterized peroxidase-related enzyme
VGFFPSLPAKTNLSDILTAWPKKGVENLLKYHDAILREHSPLTIAERELISAFVSGLNECEFCYNAHTVYAETYGIDQSAFDGLLDDVNTANIPNKMKPVLNYAKKLTLKPHSLNQSDVDAVYDAGWNEEALHDIIAVIALFNFMNRIIIGAGIDPFHEEYEVKKASVRKRPLAGRLALNEKHIGNQHYENYGKSLGIIKK